MSVPVAVLAAGVMRVSPRRGLAGRGRAARRSDRLQPSHCTPQSETANFTLMTDWAPIILTALGSGALGSIITTYGTQTRERRQARTQARDAIRRVENLTLPVPTRVNS
jgi:hypothetical protein